MTINLKNMYIDLNNGHVYYKEENGNLVLFFRKDNIVEKEPNIVEIDNCNFEF